MTSPANLLYGIQVYRNEVPMINVVPRSSAQGQRQRRTIQDCTGSLAVRCQWTQNQAVCLRIME